MLRKRTVLTTLMLLAFTALAGCTKPNTATAKTPTKPATPSPAISEPATPTPAAYLWSFRKKFCLRQILLLHIRYFV